MEPVSAFFDILASSPGIMAMSIFFFSFFIILMYNINIGILLLIFSIPLSPELTGIFGPEIPVRVDDFLIILISLVWFLKIARREAHIYKTPFTAPIVAYFTFMLISTLVGFGIKGTIDDPKYSALVLLKNLEYYMIFFIVANNIQTRRQIRNSLRLWMLAYFIVIIYGIAEHRSVPFGVPDARLYDYGWYAGQSNHMGGYLMISATIAIALFLSAKNMKLKLIYFLLIALGFYPFLFNLSKQSYLSFSTSILVFFLIFKRWLLILPIAITLILFFGVPYFFPRTLPSEAIEKTKKDSFRLSIDKDRPTSADLRRSAIMYSIQAFPTDPIIGRGTGWKGLAWYESQIPLLVVEGGIVGTGIFLWMLFRISINGLRTFLTSKDVYFKTLSAAFLASFFGILIQGVACAAWMITLVIEPFWFFAGIAVAIDRINRRETV